MEFLKKIRSAVEFILGTVIGIVIAVLKQIIAKVTLAGFIAIIAFLLFFFWELIVEQANHIAAYSLIDRGDKAYKQEKYVEAINNYERALDLYPEHVKARYNLGNIYVAYENYENAVKNYEAALEENPDFLKARINLGIILTEELGCVNEAIKHYKKAVETSPFMLGFIYNNKKEVKEDKAVAYYNMGLAYKDKFLLLGSVSPEAKKQLRLASEAYVKSLELVPDSYDSHYNLALTYQLLGNYEKSKHYYCKAINMMPLNYESHYNFGILLKQRGKFFYSIEELEKAGLILDSKGDSYRTHYVYDILNEVSSRAIIKEGLNTFVKRMEQSSVYNPHQINYIDGKVEIGDSLDKKIWENLKTCGACKGD